MDDQNSISNVLNDQFCYKTNFDFPRFFQAVARMSFFRLFISTCSRDDSNQFTGVVNVTGEILRDVRNTRVRLDSPFVGKFSARGRPRPNDRVNGELLLYASPLTQGARTHEPLYEKSAHIHALAPA